MKGKPKGKLKRKLARIGSVLMMLAILLAFSPVTFEGEVYAASVKLNKKTVYMAKGKTYQLKVKGTKAKAKWKSSDTRVVTVSKKGKLKAKNFGTATVTAKVRGKTLKCKVRVERKSEKNARKLRAFILKKGKKSGGKRYIMRQWYNPDVGEGETKTAKITASSKNNTLTFFFSQKYSEPSDYRVVTIDINLITGKTAVKTGKATYYYLDGYSFDSWEKSFGDITTKFMEAYIDETEKVEGLTETKYIECTDGEQTVTTDPANLNAPESIGIIAANIDMAGEHWNKLLAAYKPLKKAGIKMQTIGFSKMCDPR